MGIRNVEFKLACVGEPPSCAEFLMPAPAKSMEQGALRLHLYVSGNACSITAFRQARNNRPIAVHPLLLHAAVFQGLEQGAARLAIVFAIAEAAGADQVVEFDKASFHVAAADVAEAEFTDARGVDQLTAAREVEQPRRGSGVGALAGQLRQRAHAGIDFRQQAIDQRGFAHARLADKDADTSVQLLLQLFHAIAVMGRDFQHRVAQGAVDRQQRVECGGILLVDQVEFVQQQQRANAGMLGCHQVAVDQVGMGLGQWCKHDHDHVDVGRYRLELATAVGAAQFGAARQLGDDHADALVAGAPDHLVAGDQRRQVGAQVAAEHQAREFAFQRLDFDLHTEVRNYQARLFGAQVAALERFHGGGFTFGGAGGAFTLNLFDAPVLATIELAFGHWCSVSIMQRLGKTVASLARPRLLNCAATPRCQENQAMQNPQNLIWIDLEMTGLNPDTDVIIEMATIVTDSNLNTLAEGPVIAIHHSDAVLATMDEWNTRTHGNSGLTQRVRDSRISMAEAEAETIAFLEKWVPKGKSPICGNSICQDRRFLYTHMKALESYFHYRNLDVSTLKELAARWAPEVKDSFHKGSTHLALDDIRESIAELQHYRKHFIKA